MVDGGVDLVLGGFCKAEDEGLSQSWMAAWAM